MVAYAHHRTLPQPRLLLVTKNTELKTQHTLGFFCEFGGEGSGKKGKSMWKKWRTLGGEDFRRFIFLHNTKSSSFGGAQNLYWRRVLEGLYEFFKFNLCCYNILEIKNVLIISINLSFSKKYSFQKM